MEEEFAKGDYPKSIYYAKKVALYHLKLLRLSLNVPSTFHVNSFSFSKLNYFNGLGDILKEMSQPLNWVIDKVSLREYYDEINDPSALTLACNILISSQEFNPTKNLPIMRRINAEPKYTNS